VTSEQYVALVVGFMASSAVVLGPILLYLVKLKRENHADHARVVTSVEVLATQVAALTRLVVDSTAQLQAHTMWEESQKYATAETVAQLIEVIREERQ
jgi:hypothetical protein